MCCAVPVQGEVRISVEENAEWVAEFVRNVTTCEPDEASKEKGFSIGIKIARIHENWITPANRGSPKFYRYLKKEDARTEMA